MKIISRKNLVKAVTLSVLLAVPYGYAYAETYNTLISGYQWNEDEYKDIKRDVGNGNFVYEFKEGDVIQVSGSAIAINRVNSDNYNVNSITVNGKPTLNIEKNNAGSQVYAIYIDGKLVNNKSIIKDGGDINITITGKNASAIGTGINAGDGNKIELGDANIKVTANESSTYAKAPCSSR